MDGKRFEEAKRRHAGFFHPPLIAGVADLPIDGTDGSTDQFDLPTQLAPYYHILRHPNTKTPLSLAIYGSWGTGKSSAMRWLKRSLDEWTEYVKSPYWEERKLDERQWQTLAQDLAKHPKLITVEFCPWKYKTDVDLWRGILSEVILAILAENKEDLPVTKTLVQSVARFGGAFGKGVLNSIKLKFGAAFGRDNTQSNDVKNQAKNDARTVTDSRKTGFNAGANVAVEWSPQEMWETIRGELHPEDKHLNVFEKELTHFVELGLRNNRRLVVFVDDLDRCEPDVAYQMLEAVKLYLNIEGIAFVFGVDQEVLQGHIRKRYLDLGVDEAARHVGPSADALHLAEALRAQSPTAAPAEKPPETTADDSDEIERGRKADQYFKKLFSQDIVLRPPSRAMGTYIRELLKRGLDSQEALGPEKAQTAHEALAYAALSACNRNPREAKRLVNIAIAGGLATVQSTDGEHQTVEAEAFFAGAARRLLSAYLVAKGREDWTDRPNFDAFLAAWRNLHPTELKAILSETEVQAYAALDASERANFWAETKGTANQTTEKGREVGVPPTHPIPSLRDRITAATPDERRMVTEFWAFLPDTHRLRVRGLCELIVPSEAGLVSAEPPAEVVPFTIDPSHPIWIKVAEILELDDPDDIEPGMLTLVTELNLAGMQLDDLAPLRGLTQLTTLYLHNTQVQDLAPLQGLNQLTRLDLDNTKVQDLAPLQGLKQLTTLDLNYTPVQDLAPIQGLTQLITLTLDNTQVRDLAPLQGLTQLMTLFLRNTGVQDLEPIRGLTKLTELYLGSTRVHDLEPIQGLAKLAMLDLVNTQVAKADIDRFRHALPNCTIIGRL